MIMILAQKQIVIAITERGGKICEKSDNLETEQSYNLPFVCHVSH